MEKVLACQLGYIRDNFNLPECGFLPINDSDISLLSEKGVFVDRDLAESDTSMKQLIPYFAVRYQGRIFLVKRTKKQSEARLHNKLSFGLGGHVNPCDIDNGNVIIATLLRELHEELNVSKDQINDIRCYGLINDDTNDVGMVHLGVFFEINLHDDKVSINETDKMEGDWILISDIGCDNVFQYLESWSKIVFNSFYAEHNSCGQ